LIAIHAIVEAGAGAFVPNEIVSIGRVIAAHVRIVGAAVASDDGVADVMLRSGAFDGATATASRRSAVSGGIVRDRRVAQQHAGLRVIGARHQAAAAQGGIEREGAVRHGEAPSL
jgi:hypothetical protein